VVAADGIDHAAAQLARWPDGGLRQGSERCQPGRPEFCDVGSLYRPIATSAISSVTGSVIGSITTPVATSVVTPVGSVSSPRVRHARFASADDGAPVGTLVGIPLAPR
jgi:hypothetical protein